MTDRDRYLRLGPFRFSSRATRSTFGRRSWSVGSFGLERWDKYSGHRPSWSLFWKWRGDFHTSFLRPRIEWNHVNRSAQARMEAIGND